MCCRTVVLGALEFQETNGGRAQMECSLKEANAQPLLPHFLTDPLLISTRESSKLQAF